ncbi:hypothetical protein [uncultured Anaerococcus sp.]|nr:hypothetical protein [uncultured Anaerococcus sp.]
MTSIISNLFCYILFPKNLTVYNYILIEYICPAPATAATAPSTW